MKTLIIVQARMTSTRLPGKVLKEVMGKPLLAYQMERLQRVQLCDQLVVATTENDQDEPIVAFCQRKNIAYYRGSEEDVLSRYYEAARQYHGDTIVRITSDCPLIDPVVVDQVIAFYHKHDYDYVSNGLKSTYPRGMDTEIFSKKVLEEAYRNATKVCEREHVTPYMYQGNRYHLGNYSYSKDKSGYRWTVDTQDDFILVKKIIEALYPQKKTFTLEDCLELLEKNPEWNKINAHIQQKNLGE